MKTFQAATTINASPDTIWSILTDAPNYPAWDPYAERIEGRIAPGQKIKAFTTLSPGRAFPVTITEFTPGRKMTWSGGMPLGRRIGRVMRNSSIRSAEMIDKERSVAGEPLQDVREWLGRPAQR